MAPRNDNENNLCKIILHMKDNIKDFCSLNHCMSNIKYIKWKLKLSSDHHIHSKVTYHTHLECFTIHENVHNWREAESFFNQMSWIHFKSRSEMYNHSMECWRK